ncbi:uncharacterized protein LOC129281448 isoform X2 [Lytechinus pictus]
MEDIFMDKVAFSADRSSGIVSPLGSSKSSSVVLKKLRMPGPTVPMISQRSLASGSFQLQAGGSVSHPESSNSSNDDVLCRMMIPDLTDTSTSNNSFEPQSINCYSVGSGPYLGSSNLSDDLCKVQISEPSGPSASSDSVRAVSIKCYSSGSVSQRSPEMTIEHPHKVEMPEIIDLTDGKDSDTPGPARIPSNQKNVVYKKPNRMCPFCCKRCGATLKRHIRAVHKNDERVKEALKLPRKEQAIAFSIFRKEGISLSKTDKVNKKHPAYRRERRGRKSDKLIICGICQGFYSKQTLWIHKKYCKGPSTLISRFGNRKTKRQIPTSKKATNEDALHEESSLSPFCSRGSLSSLPKLSIDDVPQRLPMQELMIPFTSNQSSGLFPIQQYSIGSVDPVPSSSNDLARSRSWKHCSKRFASSGSPEMPHGHPVMVEMSELIDPSISQETLAPGSIQYHSVGSESYQGSSQSSNDDVLHTMAISEITAPSTSNNPFEPRSIKRFSSRSVSHGSPKMSLEHPSKVEMPEVIDLSDDTESDTLVPAQISSNQKNAVYRKPNRICPFCCKGCGATLKRHIRAVHKNDERVKEALKLPRKEQAIAFSIFRKEGISLSKTDKVKEKHKAYRREGRGRKSDKRTICGICQGFYSKQTLWIHKKYCKGPSTLINRFGNRKTKRLIPTSKKATNEDALHEESSLSPFCSRRSLSSLPVLSKDDVPQRLTMQELMIPSTYNQSSGTVPIQQYSIRSVDPVPSSSNDLARSRSGKHYSKRFASSGSPEMPHGHPVMVEMSELIDPSIFQESLAPGSIQYHSVGSESYQESCQSSNDDVLHTMPISEITAPSTSNNSFEPQSIKHFSSRSVSLGSPKMSLEHPRKVEMPELIDLSDDTESDTPGPAQISSNQKNAVYRKPNRMCPFCCKRCGATLKRHIRAVHKNDKRVKEAMKLPKEEQAKAFSLFRQEGIFLSNTIKEKEKQRMKWRGEERKLQN